jgi:DNA polymerase-3 subunit gamma/tau
MILSDSQILNEEKEQEFESNSRIVNQIKNVAQEEKQKQKLNQR